MTDSNFITYQCCLLLLQLAYTAWTPSLSSRLLLNLSLSRQDHIDVWTRVCMLCCEAMEHWQHMWKRIFLLDLNCDRFGVCDCYMTRSHTARQHAPTGHINQGQMFDSCYQFSWPALSRSTTPPSGIQSMQEYIQSNTGIVFTRPKKWKHKSCFILPFHPLCPFHLSVPVRKRSC